MHTHMHTHNARSRALRATRKSTPTLTRTRTRANIARMRTLCATRTRVYSSAHACLTPSRRTRTSLSRWMSWQQFRCGTNCTAFPADCISERLYREQADALKATGLLAAGYDTVHLDDCIVAKARDNVTSELVADPDRFPSGFKALGDYIHSLGAKFGFYTAMSSTTCGGYPASAHYEELDANTFAGWGVDYLKVDGCGDQSYYPVGYRKFGDALQASGRDIVYSCSWPAYLGDDETQKPFATFIEAGCNLWRNFLDMGPTVGYMQGVAEHFVRARSAAHAPALAKRHMPTLAI